MITDEERREVARRLRALPDDSTYPDLIGAIADHDGWYAAADAADRLADLIEPSAQCPYYHGDRHYCSIHDVPAIDRDALLALADEMEVTGREYRHMVNENFVTSDLIDDAPEDFVEYARRIREACGEEGR